MPKVKSTTQTTKREDLTWSPPDLATWLSEVDESKKWLVPNFIPEDALVLMSGQQKRAFKTWFAYMLALSISQKKNVGLLQPLEKLPVLIVQEEGARAQTKERILKLCRALKVDENSLSNVYFAFRERVKLDKESWRRDLVAFCKAKSIALTIFDALSYMHEGDENSNSEMAPVIDTLHALRSLNASVLALAHLDKARGENRRADIDTQVRGAGIVVNAYDVHLALRRYKMSDAHIDLTVRARDDEERKYSVAWDIGEEARLSIIQVIEGGADKLPSDKMVKQCLSSIDVGRTYSVRDLKERWGIGKQMTDKMVGYLVREGLFIEGAKLGLFIYQPEADSA